MTRSAQDIGRHDRIRIGIALMRMSLCAVMLIGAAGPVLGQTNKLRGINQGPASANLPSAERQIGRSQDRLRQDFSVRMQLETRERRDVIDQLNRDATRPVDRSCTPNSADCTR
ncbi:MAG: hypothetical protein JJ902_20635 [Roseibium sp.]|nr:hypothetical protein [Roseibium sp.]